MSKMQRSLVIIIGVILLACVALGAAGLVFWFNGGATALAGLQSQATQGKTETANGPVPTAAAPLTTGTPPARGQRPQTPVRPGQTIMGSFGVVQSVSDPAIVVSVGRQTETILVAPQARIIYAGKSTPTLSDIQKGDKLLAIGSNRNGQMNARALLVAPANYTAENLAVGQLRNVSVNTLTVQLRQGQRAVSVDADTIVYDATLSASSADQLRPGTPVVIIGQPSGDALDAQVIVAAPRAAAAPSTPTPIIR